MKYSAGPGLWLGFSGTHAVKVATSVQRNNQFTTAIVTSAVNPKRAEVVVVHLSIDEYDEVAEYGGCYIGISQRGREVATAQSTLVVSNLLSVPSLTIEGLKMLLPSRFAALFVPPSTGAYRPTPRLWEEILRIARDKIPEQSKHFEDLRKAVLAANKPLQRTTGGLEIFERDAIATAIQAWGGESMRKRVLREATAAPVTPVAPFLTRLGQVSVREDPLVIHDHATFPGMKVAQRDIVGSVLLTDGADYLTILHCNRQPLEFTLGVDLIYYSHRYDSFVLVQYKRMSDGPNGPEYRPSQDSSHDKEIERMNAASEMLSTIPTGNLDTVDAFRLSDKPFYLKLCESKAKPALDAGMVSGMYVPLPLWEPLLKSPSVCGPKGGIVVRWDNCVRRFNTSEFTKLLRDGWIGSPVGHSQILSSVIENVLQNKRMLILGATSPRAASPDYRRDTLGRFAAEDDPAGAI